MENKEKMLRDALAKGKAVYERMTEVTNDPLRHNTDFLLRILSENSQTEFGRKYEFDKIDSIDKFKASIPLTNYENYREYIDDMKNGGHNLLTRSDPHCYVTTSGSVGAPKHIPVSVEAVDGIMQGVIMSFYMQREMLKAPKNDAKSLFIISYYDVSELPSGALCGDIAGMTINSMRDFFETAYTTPACSVYANEYHDFFYVHALFALMERDMPGIGAAFMTDVFELVNYMIKHQDVLVEDIEKGTINEAIKMSDGIRSQLLQRVTPNPERAAELRAIFSEGTSDGILKRLWPKLSLITAIGSATFWPYTERVMKFAGEGVDFSHRTYAASEGQIGLVTEFNSTKYCLLPHQMFYEFIRIEDSEEENPQTLTIDQLELDKEYELVITNSSGFCRYRILDVVKVVGFLNKTPQVCFSYRRNQSVNMAGEKTTNPQIAKAIEECAAHFGCDIMEFAVYPDLGGGLGHYTILIEADDPALKHRGEEVSWVMHQKLCEANPEVAFVQAEGLLGPTEVKFVQPQTFLLYKEMKIMRGASKNQLKPVRVIDSLEKEKFFFTLLDDEE